MQTLKLAWRNLGRNRRRTIITCIGITLGLALLIFSSALGDGMHNQMIRYGVANQAGHVVVQANGWQEKREVELAVPDGEAMAKRLEEALPEARVVQRVFLQGLLTSPRNSVGVALVGVEPVIEAEVGNLEEKLVEGSYLGEDEQGIFIGAALAETLDVGLGDKVVLMTQRGGEIENALFRVSGLFKTGMAELDAFFGHVHIAAAQRTAGIGPGVSQVSVHLDDPDLSRETAAELATLVGSDTIEVLPWQKALPELYQFVVLDDGGLYVFILIIAIVVAMGILNTVLMSVLERTREFGVILSLGMSPRRLASLVMTEAFLLGVLGATLGVIVGGLLSWPIIVNGLDYAELAGVEGSFETAGVPMDLVVYGELSPVKVVIFATLAVLMTVVSAVYPTVKAARLEPVEAMHHH